MKLYKRIVTVLIIATFQITLQAQEPVQRVSYSITEGYWIRDTIVINLKDIGYNENSTLLMEVPSKSNADTGFIVIDRHSEEDDIMAIGKVVETDKTKYLYLLDERDSQGNVLRSPNPVNVTAYVWNLLGFGNHSSEEEVIILTEYLEGSLEARGKRWYLFMIHFSNRKNESMQIYSFQ